MTVADLVRLAETDGRMVVNVRIEADDPEGKNVILRYTPGGVKHSVLVHGRLVYTGNSEADALRVFMERSNFVVRSKT